MEQNEMPGFIGIIGENLPAAFDIKTKSLGARLERRRSRDDTWVKSLVVPKFLGDKLFEEDQGMFICTDGVLLNAKALRSKLKSPNNFELLKEMYRNDGVTAIEALRGSFSGVIYDGHDDVWHVFTDHLGTKPVFYFRDEPRHCMIFASELNMILSAMRQLGYRPKLCEVGAYCLLTFGFMLADYTYVQNVKRLTPGCVLTVRNDVANFTQYYKLANTRFSGHSKEMMISELDRRFRDAVRSEYEKDQEYNYGHISTLSGGLDSRMSVTYARQLGYPDVLTMTISQAGYLDEQIAKTISADYGYYFLFYSLNNGNYLKDLERPLLANDGLVLFPGSAHVLAMQTLIDWQGLGMMHTGMAGDLIMGSYLSHPFHSPPGLDTIEKVAYSTKLIKGIPSDVLDTITRSHENEEMFALYERCINGVWNGFWTAQQSTEAISPFLYVDFMDYAMSIPPRYRYKERIYHDWIRKCAPEAAEYPWEKYAGMRIGTPRAIVFAKQAMRYGKRYMGSAAYSMNPFDYWYRTNEGLRKSFASHFERDISYLQNYPKLKDDVAYLFQHGTLLEKGQCLTLLGAVRLFLSEEQLN